MSNDNDKTGYKPDITNYDYVWGSDQDEYIKQEQPADSAPEQASDDQPRP
ncbi:hypothetical protein [Paenibacillus arenilitoris]|uniref:Uncharacterized protein n=1 Tax=Paenibacillus arenilitoris TaxID=2772299 RepID=A0A927CK87_9BACL|nr:hypothetical protein [Paenibacillus arenilitoris]MBD2868267.1 hypothetical protein [Paenibacillus arenilitoris]